MNAVKNIMAGLGGAIALNILHESLKKTSKNMPRIDKLGEEAVQKGLSQVDEPIKDDDNLYAATLAADIMGNALYYSAIGAGNPKYLWLKAVALGLTAGSGAIGLPSALGLNDTPVAKNNTTKSLTVGYYLFGALVTAGILNAMKKKQKFAV